MSDRRAKKLLEVVKMNSLLSNESLDKFSYQSQDQGRTAVEHIYTLPGISYKIFHFISTTLSKLKVVTLSISKKYIIFGTNPKMMGYRQIGDLGPGVWMMARRAGRERRKGRCGDALFRAYDPTPDLSIWDWSIGNVAKIFGISHDLSVTYDNESWEFPFKTNHKLRESDFSACYHAISENP